LETVGSRFKEALDLLYGKSSSLKCGKEFDIHAQNIDRFKRSNTLTKKMMLIANKKKISIDWLETGEGEMYASSKASVVQNQSGKGNAQTHGSNNSVSIGQPTMDLRHMIDNPKSIKYNNDTLVEVPYHENIHASAGAGSYNEDSAYTTPMAFSPVFLQSHFGIEKFQGLHIINATGDSMEPTIMSGELLFVNPFENEDHQVKDGSIYVIMTTDVVMVKRVRRNPISKEMKLISDNKEVDDILLTGDMLDECRIVGRVIGHFDTL
jgi:phage repressor protein C with HTH and peptisase S24 domain